MIKSASYKKAVCNLKIAAKTHAFLEHYPNSNVRVHARIQNLCQISAK